MIIDEASKTTFQDFIVPALYAKRWIIVGDIKQLAPFAESDYLKRYFEKLVDFDRKEIFKREYQNACHFIFVIYRHYFDPKWKKTENIHFCLYCKDNSDEPNNNSGSRTLFAIFEELHKRLLDDKKISLTEYVKDSPLFCFIYDSAKDLDEFRERQIPPNFIYISKESILNGPESLLLNAVDHIFIDSCCWDEVIDKIPAKFAIINYKNWDTSQPYYRWRNLNNERKLINEIERINKDLKEKSWAHEISWRLVRIFELRNRLNSRRALDYQKQLNLLSPVSINLEGYYANAVSIALPSILESLQVGVMFKFQGNIKTALKCGLKEGDLAEVWKNRHEIMEYQFRMHPEISAFPRNEFYTDHEKKITALKDCSDHYKTDREKGWTFKPGNAPYKSRVTWIHSNSIEKANNFDREEIKIILKHLKKFMEWTKTHEHPTNSYWTVAILTFYRRQEILFRGELQRLTKSNNYFTFTIKDANLEISVHNVDKIQGQEADLVFLSMVRKARYEINERENPGGNFGFMDNPNRINVALTRARYQLVIVGDLVNFAIQNTCLEYVHLMDFCKLEGYSNMETFKKRYGEIDRNESEYEDVSDIEVKQSLSFDINQERTIKQIVKGQNTKSGAKNKKRGTENNTKSNQGRENQKKKPKINMQSESKRFIIIDIVDFYNNRRKIPHYINEHLIGLVNKLQEIKIPLNNIYLAINSELSQKINQIPELNNIKSSNKMVFPQDNYREKLLQTGQSIDAVILSNDPFEDLPKFKGYFRGSVAKYRFGYDELSLSPIAKKILEITELNR